MRVSHAIAGGLNTYTAVPAMMTATPVLGPGAGGLAERPPLDAPTLAGVLARSGYSVRAFIPDLYMNSFLKGFPERPRAVPGTSSGARDSARIERALRFLERHRHDPFFLWIHLDDPHLPWLPPAADAPPWRLPGVDDPGPENPAARYHTAVRCLTDSRSAVMAESCSCAGTFSASRASQGAAQ